METEEHPILKAARRFCDLVDQSDHAVETDIRQLLESVTRLYSEVLTLDVRSLDIGDEIDLTAFRMSKEEWEKVHAKIQKLLGKVDFYPVVPLRLDVKQGDIGLGSLSDDLADIYRDVKCVLDGIRSGGQSVIPDALLSLKMYSFETHWGEHASSVIHHLHRIVFKTEGVDI